MIQVFIVFLSIDRVHCVLLSAFCFCTFIHILQGVPTPPGRRLGSLAHLGLRGRDSGYRGIRARGAFHVYEHGHQQEGRLQKAEQRSCQEGRLVDGGRKRSRCRLQQSGPMLGTRLPLAVATSLRGVYFVVTAALTPAKRRGMLCRAVVDPRPRGAII